MGDSSTVLYFVRHAESAYVPNQEVERGLTTQGYDQSEQVSTILEPYDIDVVVSSPYTRAVETVKPLADALGTNVIIENGFRERELHHVEDFEATVNRQWQDWTRSFGSGESHDSAQQRGLKAVERTRKRWPGLDIVVGTHGTILTLILNHYNDAYDYAFWKQMTMPDIYRVVFRVTDSVSIDRIHPRTDS